MNILFLASTSEFELLPILLFIGGKNFLTPLPSPSLYRPVFSESVSGGKYPSYKAYQRRVGMFLPIDTLLRTVYYNTIAGKAAKDRTEAEVWGQPKGGKEN